MVIPLPATTLEGNTIILLDNRTPTLLMHTIPYYNCYYYCYFSSRPQQCCMHISHTVTTSTCVSHNKYCIIFISVLDCRGRTSDYYMYIIHIITDASTHAYVYPKPAILFFRLNDDP